MTDKPPEHVSFLLAILSTSKKCVLSVARARVFVERIRHSLPRWRSRRWPQKEFRDSFAPSYRRWSRHPCGPLQGKSTLRLFVFVRRAWRIVVSSSCLPSTTLHSRSSGFRTRCRSPVCCVCRVLCSVYIHTEELFSCRCVARCLMEQ